MTARQVVGGLLVHYGGRLISSSVRHDYGPRPVCWRCGVALYLDAMQLVSSDDDAHPFVWICAGCTSDGDRAAMAEPDGRGVR